MSLNCGNKEFASLLLGIICCTISIIAVLFSIGRVALMFVMTKYYNEQVYEYGTIILSLPVMMSLVVISMTTFVLSICLGYGVLNRKSAHVKAYFIYGILLVVLSILAMFLYSILEGDSLTLAVAAVAISFYSLTLVMVRNTYKKFESEENEHIIENSVDEAWDYKMENDKMFLIKPFSGTSPLTM